MSCVDLRRQLYERLGTRPLTISSIADDLYVSRSQVQRTLRSAGTSFTAELIEARLRVALRLLISERVTVSEAARRVGVSPDHLCVMVKSVTRIPARDVRHAAVLVARIKSYREMTPPAFGSGRYWVQRRRWERAERRLKELLKPVPPGTSMRTWADAALAFAQRPDYRSKPYRERARKARTQEKERALAIQKELATLFADWEA